MNTFDVIVLGVGGMGSATVYELARRGHRVLGLEQFPLVHDQGSSHGHTRIIRQAYYEHPAYVPLVLRAYERWYELEQITGKHLLTPSPCLSIGLPNSELIEGVNRSAQQHRLSVENLSAAQIRQRFPAFQVSDAMVGILEHSAGFLYVEECVRSYINASISVGATIYPDEPVQKWVVQGQDVFVTTKKATYTAKHLVITAGPWATLLLGQYARYVRVMRQVILWFETSRPDLFRRDRFPIFLHENESGAFYGLPAIDQNGVKMARHYGAEELTTPEQIQREITDADVQTVRSFMGQVFPLANGTVKRSQTCIYTLSPDRHFILDKHPEHPQVVIATGFSGHGFKFASVVGEILADLTETGSTPHPIQMFRWNRLS